MVARPGGIHLYKFIVFVDFVERVCVCVFVYKLDNDLVELFLPYFLSALHRTKSNFLQY